MTDPVATVLPGAHPRLPRGVRLVHNEAQGGWVLLAPERLFLPDETAVEILKLVDGNRSIGLIADDLAARYDAPRDLIIKDVLVTLGDLAAKGAVQW